jgi:hypothetical protein
MIDRVLQDCVIVAELEKNRCGTVQHWAPCLGKTALDNCFLSSRGALSDSAAAGFCLPGNHVPAGCHGAACRQRLCTNPRPACSPSSPSSLQIAVRRAYALHPRSGSGYRRALVQAPPPLQCRHWAENGLPGFCREALNAHRPVRLRNSAPCSMRGVRAPGIWPPDGTRNQDASLRGATAAPGYTSARARPPNPRKSKGGTTPLASGRGATGVPTGRLTRVPMPASDSNGLDELRVT